MTTDSRAAKLRTLPCVWPYDLEELRRALATLEQLRNQVGTVNPRPPGWHNDLLQLIKKSLARALAWYTRPLHEYHAALDRSLEEILHAVEYLSTNLVALDERVAHTEKRDAIMAVSMREQLELVHQEVQALLSLKKTAKLEAPAGGMEIDRKLPAYEDSRTANNILRGNGSAANDRTAYVIGLFGTGRLYLSQLMLQHIGERAKYFRDEIRLHSGPTSMIYSGHVTVKYVSRQQDLPAIMSGIAEAVQARFADSIFIFRHPLDSLLTNWIWWRTYIRDNRMVSGISQVYKDSDDLCADVEQNFFEFKAFAEGDPDFYAVLPGPRFLSFSEFVEETALHLQSATLTLQLEDFMIDPLKEFSKIAEVMSVDLDLGGLQIAPPRTKPYGYLAVKEKVPRFKAFIDRLNAETKRRIEKIGYHV